MLYYLTSVPFQFLLISFLLYQMIRKLYNIRFSKQNFKILTHLYHFSFKVPVQCFWKSIIKIVTIIIIIYRRWASLSTPAESSQPSALLKRWNTLSKGHGLHAEASEALTWRTQAGETLKISLNIFANKIYRAKSPDACFFIQFRNSTKTNWLILCTHEELLFLWKFQKNI